MTDTSGLTIEEHLVLKDWMGNKLCVKIESGSNIGIVIATNERPVFQFKTLEQVSAFGKALNDYAVKHFGKINNCTVPVLESQKIVESDFCNIEFLEPEFETLLLSLEGSVKDLAILKSSSFNTSLIRNNLEDEFEELEHFKFNVMNSVHKFASIIRHGFPSHETILTLGVSASEHRKRDATSTQIVLEYIVGDYGSIEIEFFLTH